MRRGSFTFGGIDLKAVYGVTVEEVHDLILPAIRPRTTLIPGRDGVYDYGARNYDQRLLSLDCSITRPMTRGEVREVSYLLSQKAQIVLWQEPDKTYIGRIYNPQELQRVGTTQKRFVLQFTCEPFAYGETVTQALSAGENPVAYAGTARAPTLIVLRNTGAAAVTRVQLRAVYHR